MKHWQKKNFLARQSSKKKQLLLKFRLKAEKAFMKLEFKVILN